MKVVLLTVDLMSASQIELAAASADTELAVVDSAEALVEFCSEAPVDLVVFDLASVNGEIADVATKLSELPEPPGKLIAFGPHVHELKLQAARDAGFHEVLARGQFLGSLHQYLSP